MHGRKASPSRSNSLTDTEPEPHQKKVVAAKIGMGDACGGGRYFFPQEHVSYGDYNSHEVNP